MGAASLIVYVNPIPLNCQSSATDLFRINSLQFFQHVKQSFDPNKQVLPTKPNVAIGFGDFHGCYFDGVNGNPRGLVGLRF